MQRVMYVHQDGVLSGSAISLGNLLKNLDRRRFEPTILMGRDGPARSFFEQIVPRVTVIPIPGFWTSPSLPFWRPDYYRNFRALWRQPTLEQYFQNELPDLVHINDKAMLAAGMAAARNGIPVIWHLRSAYAGGRSRLLNAVSRWVITRYGSRAIAISEDEVEGFDRSLPVDVIYNAVDINEADRAISRARLTRAKLGIGDNEVAIAMVGFLTKRKGAWDFIRAAGILKKRMPDANLRFLMVAPIPDRTPLNWGIRGRLHLIDTTHPQDRAWQLAREAKVADQLTMTGRRDDILDVLAAVDIVSVCYRLWAIGRPAFEGMSVGKPVVVNEGHSGSSGIVRNGETGIVVRRADPQEQARALQSLVESPSKRAGIGAAARAHARLNFDVARNTRQIESIYQSYWHTDG